MNFWHTLFLFSAFVALVFSLSRQQSLDFYTLHEVIPKVCILVGENTIVGRLTSSRATLTKLITAIMAASDQGEAVWITIVWIL